MKKSDEVVISLPVDLFTQEGTICNYNNLLDMFFRNNFHYLTDAIDAYTVKETNELKAGLRQNIFYIIKKGSKIMQNHFYIKDKDEIAKEIEFFLKCFHADEENLTGCAGCARYQLDKQVVLIPESLHSYHWNKI